MATQRLSQAAILSAPAAAPVASRSLAEARARARSFFREICREVPWVVKNYQLGEITTVGRLRSQLATHFRRVETDNPKVIDLMLFKGQAEVHEMMAHYTQRHHLITRYVAPANETRSGAERASSKSDFFKRCAACSGSASSPHPTPLPAQLPHDELLENALGSLSESCHPYTH